MVLGTDLSPHSSSPDIHEFQGILRHTYSGGIPHHMCEEIRKGQLVKTQERVEISQVNEETASCLNCWWYVSGKIVVRCFIHDARRLLRSYRGYGVPVKSRNVQILHTQKYKW